MDTVEVVSADPISNPVPECMKNISSFPVRIRYAVGTTFGALENIRIMQRFEDCFLYIFVDILLFKVESPKFVEAILPMARTCNAGNLGPNLTNGPMPAGAI